MKWQPIESAPKDQIILLYRPGHRVSWQSVAPGKYNDDKYAKRPRPFWASWMLCSGKLDDRFYPPTHWMPMPNPPTSEENLDG
jgi:hypothetical protein